VRRHRRSHGDSRDYYDEVHYSPGSIGDAIHAKLAVSDPWYALVLELLERNGVAGGGRTLEVGCGLGGFSQRLERRLEEDGGSVVGADFSLSALGAARHHAGEHGSSVRFVAADARRLPFADQSFHLVVCAETLEHTFAVARCVRELHRVTAPGGFVAVTVPNATMAFPLGLLVHAVGADQPQVLVTASRLRRHVEDAGFDVVDGDGTNHFRDMILNDVLSPAWRSRAEHLGRVIDRAIPRSARRWALTAGTVGILARRPARVSA
jgi:2-polyprenyl-3-methyl-5-hydroxy-6-metoxy-1,4-benzoquinol methylase